MSNDDSTNSDSLPADFASIVASRPCASCTACCYALGVIDLEPVAKQHEEQCTHVCKQGCSIYKDRPPTCRDFHCGWQLGIDKPENQPDKVGYVIQLPTDIKGDELFVQVREAYPRAFDKTEVMYEITQLAEKLVVVLIRGAKRSAIGPVDRLSRFMDNYNLHQHVIKSSLRVIR